VVAGLHGINALLLVSLAAYVVVSTWAFRERAAAPARSREVAPTA
jgi:hypothetical protein